MGDDSRRDGFDRPRVLVAGAFTGLICVLALIDAATAEYTLDVVTLGLLIGVIAGLLGIEVRDVIRSGKD